MATSNLTRRLLQLSLWWEDMLSDDGAFDWKEAEAFARELEEACREAERRDETTDMLERALDHVGAVMRKAGLAIRHDPAAHPAAPEAMAETLPENVVRFPKRPPSRAYPSDGGAA